MDVSPEQQRKIIEEGWPIAKHRLMAKLNRDGQRLFALAIERGATIGADQYGDKSFHLSKKELDKEIDEELADAIFYECIYHKKDTE
jgi:hypothetical protein